VRSPPILTMKKEIVKEGHEETAPKQAVSKVQAIKYAIKSALQHHPIFEYRVPFHLGNYPSPENISKYFLKSFMGGFIPVTMINTLLTLTKFRQCIHNPKLILDAVVSKSNLQFGLFVGSFTTIYKLSMTFLEVIRNGSDPMNRVISEAVAGILSFIMLGNGSSLIFAYAIIKGFMFFLNSSAFKKIKQIKTKKYIFYLLGLVFLSFCLIRDNQNLSQWIKNILS